MTTRYNPANWYWVVAGSTSQVYSSLVGDYVPTNNTAYQKWTSSGGNPTRIASESELGNVLSAYSLTPTPAGILDGYKDAQASGLIVQTEFRILFNHENRLRACERALSLNGSPADLTPAQAKAAVKAIM